MTTFTEKIELELAHNKIRRQWNWVRLPIKTLDGIKCDVRLISSKAVKCDCGSDCDKPNWYLKIETMKNCVLVDSGEIDEHEYYSEKIEDLENVKDILQSLRFNRFENRFQPLEAIDWSFIESDTVKLKYDTCCVCYEKTVSRTNCGHILCIPCYDKIPEDTDSQTPCPMCREDCLFEDGTYLGF
jgi:hypothetical protein